MTIQIVVLLVEIIFIQLIPEMNMYRVILM